MMQEIQNKTSEFYKLSNRLDRYWKRLVSISGEEIIKQGIGEIVLTDNPEDQLDNVLSDPSTIQVYEEGDSCNAFELLEFAKNVAPSLYRKYRKDLKKYNLLIEELSY